MCHVRQGAWNAGGKSAVLTTFNAGNWGEAGRRESRGGIVKGGGGLQHV